MNKVHKKVNLSVMVAISLTLSISNGYAAPFDEITNSKEMKNIDSLTINTSNMVNEIKKEKKSLENTAKNDKNLENAIIADLEKSCKGKAKQDTACATAYVNNIDANVGRLLKENTAVRQVAENLNRQWIAKNKEVNTQFQSVNKQLDGETLKIEKNFKTILNNEAKKIPASEKKNIPSDILDMKKPLFDNQSSFNSNSYNFTEANFLNPFFEKTLNFFIPPAHAADPLTVTIVTMITATALAAIAKYVEVKTSPQQVDRTAKCIDDADAAKRSCDNTANSRARAACPARNFSWMPFGSTEARNTCITAKAALNRTSCGVNHAATVTACMLLPQ